MIAHVRQDANLRCSCANLYIGHGSLAGGNAIEPVLLVVVGNDREMKIRIFQRRFENRSRPRLNLAAIDGNDSVTSLKRASARASMHDFKSLRVDHS